MSKPALAVLLASSCAIHGQCFAQDSSGYYVGAATGQSGLLSACNTDPSTIRCERRHFFGKLIAGYRYNPHLAVEAAYADLGRASADSVPPAPAATGTVSVKAVELDAIGVLPVREHIFLFGRLGAFRATSKAQLTGDIPGFGAAGSGSATTVGLTRGVGLAIALSPRWRFRAELQRYPNVGGGVVGATNIDAAHVGLIYGF